MARRPTPWFRKDRNAWFVTIDGVRHNLGPTKKEAFDQFYAMMAQPRAPRVQAEAIPFATLADRFLEWVQRKRSPDTYEWYRYRLERFVQKYPDLKAPDVRPHHVEAWVDDYDFTVTSRRNYMRTVKRCLNWSLKQGFIDVNPVATLEIPSADHKEVAFTPDQVETLLRYIRNPSLRDLVITTIETGCRPQESLRVEARHVDHDHQRWVIPKRESKTKRITRVVYLNDRAMEITRRLAEQYPTGALFRNSNGKAWSTEAVNCAFQLIRQRMGKDEMKKRGLEITPEQIAEKVATLCKTRKSRGKLIAKTAAELRCEAKRKLTNRLALDLVPPYSLYALRHSWATQALLRGVDPLTVAILMGHEDPSMLSKVYQHLALNPKHMLDEARRATKPAKKNKDEAA